MRIKTQNNNVYTRIVVFKLINTRHLSTPIEYIIILYAYSEQYMYTWFSKDSDKLLINIIQMIMENRGKIDEGKTVIFSVIFYFNHKSLVIILFFF